MLKNNITSDKDIYEVNCVTNVGGIIKCPNCHNNFIKKTYNQKFCCIKCKDNYHNHNNPERAVRQRNFWNKVKEENAKVTNKYVMYE